jgi:hypothetical protein
MALHELPAPLDKQEEDLQWDALETKRPPGPPELEARRVELKVAKSKNARGHGGPSLRVTSGDPSTPSSAVTHCADRKPTGALHCLRERRRYDACQRDVASEELSVEDYMKKILLSFVAMCLWALCASQVDASALTFRGVLRPGDIIVGADVGGTGHSAVNFTGQAGPAGDTWIAVFDSDPFDATATDIFSGGSLSTDVLINRFNNKKGAGLLALYNEAPLKNGLALIVYDSASTDTLVLATVDQDGKLVILKTMALPGGPIAENAWYRLTMDVFVTGGTTVEVTGKVFKHLTATNPDSAVGAQIGNTLTFSGPLPAGVDPTGQVGIIASAIGAVVDSSVANFVSTPPPLRCSDPGSASGQNAKMFRFTGSEQSFTVPSGVSQIFVEVWGAGGGGGSGSRPGSGSGGGGGGGGASYLVDSAGQTVFLARGGQGGGGGVSDGTLVVSGAGGGGGFSTNGHLLSFGSGTTYTVVVGEGGGGGDSARGGSGGFGGGMGGTDGVFFVVGGDGGVGGGESGPFLGFGRGGHLNTGGGITGANGGFGAQIGESALFGSGYGGAGGVGIGGLSAGSGGTGTTGAGGRGTNGLIVITFTH